MESIGDAWGFIGKTPITPSRGFSVETLTRVTLSWKTELNRSIPAVEDGIPGGLQHYHKTCYKKCGCHGSMGLYVLEVVSLWERYFRTGRLVYNKRRVNYIV